VSEPEQVADFLKGRVVGQIVDVVAAIGEDSLVTVDVADAGGGGDYPFESLGGVQAGDAGHGSSLAMRMDFVASGAIKEHGATLFYTPTWRRFPARLTWKCVAFASASTLARARLPSCSESDCASLRSWGEP